MKHAIASSGASRHADAVVQFTMLCAAPLRALFDVGAISVRSDHPGYNRLVKLEVATSSPGRSDQTVFGIAPKIRDWRSRQNAKPTAHLIAEVAHMIADREVFGR